MGLLGTARTTVTTCDWDLLRALGPLETAGTAGTCKDPPLIQTHLVALHFYKQTPLFSNRNVYKPVTNETELGTLCLSIQIAYMLLETSEIRMFGDPR